MALVVLNQALKLGVQILKERHEDSNGQGTAQRQRDDWLRTTAENTENMRAHLEALRDAQLSGLFACSWTATERQEQRDRLRDIEATLHRLEGGV